MYLPVLPQHSCPLAWPAAVKAVDAAHGHEAHNVIIGVEDPVLDTTRTHHIVAAVNDFLRERDKSVFAVANTIFPSSLYERHGEPDIFSVFHHKILPRVRKNQRWSGYYFERMTDYPTRRGEPFNPLWDIVQRIRKSGENPSNNKYELSLYDPERAARPHRNVPKPLLYREAAG
jgi:hypothetical protein